LQEGEHYLGAEEYLLWHSDPIVSFNLFCSMSLHQTPVIIVPLS